MSNNNKQNNTYSPSSTTGYNDLATYSMPLSMLHIINIDRPITSVDDWRHELSVITSATENDIIHLKISTGGGDATTMVTFIDALRRSPAWIVSEITGECCSAGTAIFLQGNEFIVNPLILSFMVHQPSHGYGGTDSNVFDYAQHSRKTNTKLMRDIYKDFLTDEEMDLVLEGKEVWLDASQVEDRCENLLKARESALEEYQTAPHKSISYTEMCDMTREEMLKHLFGDMDEQENLEETTTPKLTEKDLKKYKRKDLLRMYPHCGGTDSMSKPDLIKTIINYTTLQK